MRFTNLFAMVSIVFMSFAGESYGSIIYGDTADRELKQTGGFRGATQGVLLGGGYRGNDSTEVNAVVVFDVSSIVPGTVTTASLSVYLDSVAQAGRIPNSASSDWYLAGFSSTANPANDTPAGLTFTNSNSGSGTKIADNIVNENSTAGQYYSSSGAAIASALNSRATNGSQDFVYFQLATDAPVTQLAYQGFNWAAADKSGTSIDPYLDVQTGTGGFVNPELTSLVTWSVLAVIPIGIWRRRDDD